MAEERTTHDWHGLWDLSQVLAKSGCMPVDINGKRSRDDAPRPATAEELFVLTLAGDELGMPPMQSIRHLMIRNGRVSTSAESMWGLVKHSNFLENSRFDETPTSCKLTVKRKGDLPYSWTYTIADATKAGIAGQSNWMKYPAAMLRARAISAVCRVVFPDVCGGLYTPDEVAEDSGEIESHPEVPEPEKIIPPTPEPVPPEPEPPKPEVKPEQDWTTILNGIKTVGGSWTDEQHAELLIAFSSTKMKPAWATQLLEKLSKTPTTETAALGISFFRTRGILPTVQEPAELPQETAKSVPGAIEEAGAQKDAQEVTESKGGDTEGVAGPDTTQS